MQYHLVHRGAVIKTFETNEMDPVEIQEMKRLHGTYFKIERATPDRLPPIHGYSMLADVVRERALSDGSGFRTGINGHKRRKLDAATRSLLG